MMLSEGIDQRHFTYTSRRTVSDNMVAKTPIAIATLGPNETFAVSDGKYSASACCALATVAGTNNTKKKTKRRENGVLSREGITMEFRAHS